MAAPAIPGTTPSTEASREAQLLERLHVLIRDHSQAEIARRTGRSRNALSRYAQGAKIPLEFATALSESFGVSPSWLLTGEGPPYLTDVPQSSAELGRQVLELMRAMDSVGRVRLGSLAGKNHAKVLRELSDSMAVLGSLRDRLNSVTQPILKEMVAQLMESVRARDIPKAKALLKVANQLESFCQDRVLVADLLHIRAHILYNDGNVHEAMRLQGESFHRGLDFDSSFQPVAVAAYNLARLCRNNGFSTLARRVTRTAMAFADQSDIDSADYVLVACEEALNSIEAGELRDVANWLAGAYRPETEVYRKYADQVKVRVGLLTGQWRPEEIAGAKALTSSECAELIYCGGLLEQGPVLEAAHARFKEVMSEHSAVERYIAARAEAGFRAIRGQAKALQIFDNAVNDLQDSPSPYLARTFSYNTCRAQLFRLLKRHNDSAALVLDNHRLLGMMAGKGMTPDIYSRLNHIRNIRHAAAGSKRKKEFAPVVEWAEQESRRLLAAGYLVIHHFPKA